MPSSVTEDLAPSSRVGARALAGRVGGAISIRILGAGIGLGTQILLARLLGADQYGFYIYALTCAHVLSLVGRLGANTAALRFVPAYEALGEWGLLRGFLSRSRQIPLVVSTALAAATAAGVWSVSGWLGNDLTVALWLACAIIPLEVVLEVQGSLLLGFRRVVPSQVPHMILRPTLVVVLVGAAVYGWTVPATAAAALCAELAAVTITLALSTWLLRRAYPPALAETAAHFRTAEWGRASLHLWLIAHLQLALSQTDTLLIGIFHGTTVAGIYSASSRLTRAVLFGLDAGNQVVAPTISRLYTQGRTAELQRTITLAARGIFLFTVPTAIALIIAGRSALEMFGPAFVAGYAVLVILLAGQVVNALTGSVGFLMTMTGHERKAMQVIGATAVGNLALNAVLIPAFGIVGAAVATALSVAVRNVALAVCVWKYVGIRSTVV